MLRRLFFLFPDEEHAETLVRELQLRGVSSRHIHAIANNIKLSKLPEATERQKRDVTFKLEKLLWFSNLILFALASLSVVAALVLGEMLMAAVALVVAIGCFIAGEQFVVKVPDVHLTEFTDALKHGEILLMIDVPAYRVAEIEEFIHYRHPEAVVGGVGWTVDAFGM